MVGSISTLGIGSGLDLQNILDQLKEAEKAPITAKENKKAEIQKQIDAYNGVNVKLFSMKSSALSLSLESNFLKNKVSIGDEDIITATANDGIKQSSHSIEVIQKAQYHSWQTNGIADKDGEIFEKPATGIESITTSVTTEASTMIINYGALEDQKAIGVSLDSDMSLEQIVEAVNSAASNEDEEGNPLVNASIGSKDGEYYVRIASASGEDSADSQINVAGYDYVIADTAISIGKETDPENTMFISIAPGTTYEQLVERINAASDNPGATATLVDTGSAENPYRLTLTSNSTGESNRITVQPDGLMTQITGTGEESLNAIFKVNGVEYQRQTNDGITDVISGVTLNLKKVGESSFGIQTELDTVKENITAFIEDFNELISEIAGKDEETDSETETDTEEEGALSDSYDVKNMISKLKSLVTTNVETDSIYSSLIDLGLEINKDGTMSIDEAVLDQAIASNPEAIQSLFIGDEENGTKGLGDIINDELTQMVGSQGLVLTEISAAETKIKRMDEDIESATAQLDKRYTSMTADFIRLDKYIGSLNAQAAALTSMIESISSQKD